MSWFSFNSTTKPSVWEDLVSLDQLDEIIEESNRRPVLIFKHSTRCSISIMAVQRVESNWPIEADEAKAYYLDLLKYRPVSNEIEYLFNVVHQSPQVLIIKDGKCTYHASHSQIESRAIRKEL